MCVHHIPLLGQTHITWPAIEVEEARVKWAMAGTNVTVALANIDPINLNIGSVLCFPGETIPLAVVFTARIIVFDIAVPITAGTSVGSRLYLEKYGYLNIMRRSSYSISPEMSLLQPASSFL